MATRIDRWETKEAQRLRGYRAAQKARKAVLLLAVALLAGVGQANAQEVACGEESGAVCTPGQAWIRGPAGPLWAELMWVDGEPVFEGDIAVQLVSYGDVTAESAIIAGPMQPWPGGVMPFTIDPALPNPQRVHDAIAHWQARTHVRLVPRTNQTDFVTFRPAGGCSSNIGRIGGQQFVNLATGCTTGNTIHEIGHAFGLWHEQSRHDRDSFVAIQWSNIQPGLEGNFQLYPEGFGVDAGPYDYESIMHYPGWAFSINGQPTIVPLQPLPPGVVLGQRTALSAGDTEGIAEIYVIPELSVTGAELLPPGSIRYTISVGNHAEIPDDLFAPAPHLPPCGSNSNSSRTWVDLFDASGNRVNQFCALASSGNLTSLWFAVPASQPIPEGAYLELWDRERDVVHRSNTVSLRPKLAITDAEPAGGGSTRYFVSVTNPELVPEALFDPAPHLPPCGANPNASRTWVYIVDSLGNALQGFCVLSANTSLSQLWFSVSTSQSLPADVHLAMWDREEGVVHETTAATFPQCGDRVDNDGNGKVDYPDDPGCASFADNKEGCGLGFELALVLPLVTRMRRRRR